MVSSRYGTGPQHEREGMTEDIDNELQDLLGEMEEQEGAESGADEAEAATGGDDEAMDFDLGGEDEPGEAAAGGGDDDAMDFDLGDIPDAAEDEAAAGDAGEAGDGLDEALNALGASEEGGGAGGEDTLGGMGGGGLDVPDMSGGSSRPEEGFRPSAVVPSRGQEPAVPGEGENVNLDFLLDIKLNVTFEVGRSKMLVADLLTLGQGSVIELHRLVGDELDLLVNGRLVAKGEVVVVNEKFGCKITEIIAPEERVKHLGGL